MSLSRNIRGLHFFIAGAASSGISVAKLLKKNGANIFITDENKISDKIKNEINELNLAFEENGHSFNKIINECDILVISPGIPLHKEISILCKKNYIPILSEIEIASWFMNPNSLSLGVTGTNGKSTTVNYLSQLFFNSKYKIKACGNIGVSVSQTITENPETNLFAIEFSSYQLETTYSIRPICTALLNIQNDHLARYEDMNEYLKAKWRLILLTDDNGLAIIDKNIMNHVLKLGLSLPRSKIILIDESNSRKESKNLKLEPILNSIQFGKTLPNAIYQQLNTLSFENIILPNQFDSAYAEYNIDGSISISLNYNNIAKNWNIKTPCIPGRHNMTNILCANLIAMHLGISDEIILNQWEEKTSNYEHLPHRLEKISSKWNIFLDQNSNKKTVLIINDSKSTNVESVLVALNSFQSPIRLLLGGEAKGDSYLPISRFINKNIIKIYPFGKASNIIKEQLINYKNNIAEPSSNMITAANLALNDANDNEIILLSPACSSFDEFQNFEHRGNVFREWALSHLKDRKK